MSADGGYLGNSGIAGDSVTWSAGDEADGTICSSIVMSECGSESSEGSVCADGVYGAAG